jgi:hypothetical protein
MPGGFLARGQAKKRKKAADSADGTVARIAPNYLIYHNLVDIEVESSGEGMVF